MSQNQGKSEDWLHGYADGLMTAKRVITTLSRNDIPDIVDVLEVMARAIRPVVKK